ERLNAGVDGKDLASTDEMHKLLEEFNARADETSASESTGNDLLKRLAEMTEKSAEKLTKRNEVSKDLLPSPTESLEFFPLQPTRSRSSSTSSSSSVVHIPHSNPRSSSPSWTSFHLFKSPSRN